MELTAVHNPLVQAAAALKQKKYRLQRREFLAEGLRTAEEAVRSGTVRQLFYTPTQDQRTLALLEKAAAAAVELICVSENVMHKLADTDTPQGVIALCAMPACTLAELLGSGRLLLVLDRVGDPGNVGTIVRTADAAGIAGLLLLRGSADVYAPKTVRASMGSLFHLPVLQGMEAAELPAALQQYGYTLLALDARGATSIYQADFSGRLALLLGNEATGVSSALAAAAAAKVYIPMRGRAESLNVAMAAAIVVFEALRRQLG